MLTPKNLIDKIETSENFSVIDYMPRSYLKVMYCTLFYLLCQVHVTAPPVIPPNYFPVTAPVSSPLCFLFG